mmetsp:Transcript_26975/g.56947  ORF Transcript_26975/g.56947 Transcript_26975/m.56947 type:complete len:1064 (-) Transcript_26975:58-3249(-)|eukprot:CAMPEP_0183718582 /NCGR_PEP_ID=MMETSP0737-20130205/11808_1 /TAXON_ID=385413 /ORGANISM="Thalassiosira miniscula, Strain CCMP1093" /LENGTH=1063 /DNA_ID=CAMNT_0025948171 /DNA_START=81 /DNA_END=3275 /DNA_ORIENTATION=-
MSGGRGRGGGEKRGNERHHGRGRGKQGKKHSGGRGSSNNNRQPKNPRSQPQSTSSKRRKKILLLHGNRQTGEILLGRIDKLKKTLLRDFDLDVVAPDAPHFFSDGIDFDCDDTVGRDGVTDDSTWQRTWWHRRENTYQGMEESMYMLHQLWSDDNLEFESILGFSQGSRLAHFIAIIHTITNGAAFPGLKSVVHFSGYGDVPLPDNFCKSLSDEWREAIPSFILAKLDGSDQNYNFDDVRTNVGSLHVMGEKDTLIPLKSSEALLKWYVQPSVYIHPGNHFVPVKRQDIEKYVEFFNDMTKQTQQYADSADGDEKLAIKDEEENNQQSNISTTAAPPDEEHAQAHIDEVAALTQIFPVEFSLLSNSTPRDPENYDPDDYFEENRIYEHPIKYSILLQPQDSLDPSEEQLWPPKNISLGIQYPAEYPDVSPSISLIHDMNYFEFSLAASDALMDVVRKAMSEELGMPCVMGMIYAARDFFEGGQLALCAKTNSTKTPSHDVDADVGEPPEVENCPTSSTSALLRKSSPSRIKECNAQGLQIASAMLGRVNLSDDGEAAIDGTTAGGKGGTWRYTVGLVGKPSAGKSTFFNAATAFARQKGEGGGEAYCEDKTIDDDEDSGIILGGASMAPHPFTTIDPNIGYCLVPAPGICPEDAEGGRKKIAEMGLTLGSSHGRDSHGRRFIPVCLKDVAGLVPGAYQGRGRGNKFLDDLTDADVLVHIVDASGSSDAEGNKLCNSGNSDDLNHPLNDLEWVRSELVEWVYSNVTAKWDSITRRGKEKLVGMFSGYKQSQAFTYDVFSAVEKFVTEKEGREHMFEQLENWDEGDLHRLVSAFLGARFPMALALNKQDIPSSKQYINDIESKLPIHGAHIGVGVSAHEEMKFIRHHLTLAIKTSSNDSSLSQQKSTVLNMDGGVWDCLQSAVSLRQPTLVFPVNDMQTYEPLPGMTNYATRDSSLPNRGFISCILAAGGSAPSQWNGKNMYVPSTKGDVKHALRDALLMKPGSTVEDVFVSLKGLGVLEGEFVRAEKSFQIGQKPKPASKNEQVATGLILRIMTTRRKKWQTNY